MEKISWVAKVSNSEVLKIVSGRLMSVQSDNENTAGWIMFCDMNDVLLRYLLEGRSEVEEERGYRRWTIFAMNCKETSWSEEINVEDGSHWPPAEYASTLDSLVHVDCCTFILVVRFCICRKDRKMALIQMGSVEQAVGALVVNMSTL